ncbi:MAG: Hint domain-containing protein, partial [Alphaproteobacteria bacterium]|nr:Hint domain-containing protein [Alphaproteobacteria bacterium]
MALTLDKDGLQVATESSNYGASVNTATVMVINFSDGARIAITDFDDDEANDPIYGVEAASGGMETVNLYMYGMNMSFLGATFKVYNYSTGSLGSLLYTYRDVVNGDGTIQFNYDTAADTLSIYTSTQGIYPNSNGTVSGFSGTLVYGGVVCFLRGALILTARGEVPVETLRAGDLVVTKFGGLRPVRWIGTQRFEGRLAGKGHQPIRFARGSLGNGVPSCDLRVSPGHAMLVQDGQGGEVLAHAGALVNGSTIAQERVRGEIEYFHIDLGPHDCVLANGAWAESYFEDRNRDAFHNAAAFHALNPGHETVRQATCLPI